MIAPLAFLGRPWSKTLASTPRKINKFSSSRWVFLCVQMFFRGHVFASYFSFIVFPNRQARRFSLVACQTRLLRELLFLVHFCPPLSRNHCRHVLDHYSLCSIDSPRVIGLDCTPELNEFVWCSFNHSAPGCKSPLSSWKLSKTFLPNKFANTTENDIN